MKWNECRILYQTRGAEISMAGTSGKKEGRCLKFKKLVRDRIEALLKGRVSFTLSETGDFF